MIISTFNIKQNYNLQMPLSSGTVTTPYDSRMIQKRAELHGKIAARTKRKMKARTKLIRTNKPIQTPSYIVAMGIVVFPALLAAIILSPLYLTFPTL